MLGGTIEMSLAVFQLREEAEDPGGVRVRGAILRSHARERVEQHGPGLVVPRGDLQRLSVVDLEPDHPGVAGAECLAGDRERTLVQLYRLVTCTGSLQGLGERAVVAAELERMRRSGRD